MDAPVFAENPTAVIVVESALIFEAAKWGRGRGGASASTN